MKERNAHLAGHLQRAAGSQQGSHCESCLTMAKTEEPDEMVLMCAKAHATGALEDFYFLSPIIKHAKLSVDKPVFFSKLAFSVLFTALNQPMLYKLCLPGLRCVHTVICLLWSNEVIILKDSLLCIPMTLFPKMFLVSWAARRWSSVWIVPNAILCIFRFPAATGRGFLISSLNT